MHKYQGLGAYAACQGYFLCVLVLFHNLMVNDTTKQLLFIFLENMPKPSIFTEAGAKNWVCIIQSSLPLEFKLLELLGEVARIKAGSGKQR